MNNGDDEHILDEGSDEEDWEEVLIEQPQHLDITINQQPKAEVKKKGISPAERLLRVDCHKLHTICLIANAQVRNRWLNDELLHARLVSLTPMPLQTAFAMIHKSRFPDQAKRGRMFESSLTNLVNWWTTSFFQVVPEGHLRSRTFDSVQKHLSSNDTVLDRETLEDILDDEGELIRRPKSLMKHALMQSGSRDTSAQLFTALCRGLGLPTRLVVSLQSVPWKSSIGKTRPPDKGKARARPLDVSVDEAPVASSSKAVFPGDGERLDGSSTPKSDKGKGKEKAKPVINLRRSQNKGNVLGKKLTLKEDPLSSPPVFWTEVFSRPDGRWIPIDPLRAIVNKATRFDPPPTSTQNRMLYVLAFEEDGYARDVTRKYAKQYASKIMKAQGGSAVGGGGKVRVEWWQRIVASLTRPYRLNRDDVEDIELDSAQYREGMPTTLAGFKDHPLYVIPRHLRQTETIHPPPPDTPELGTFRGEPVYPRSAVVSLKTAETWMRTEGRVIQEGAHALKMIKTRTGTIAKQRELELLKDGLREAGEASGVNGEQQVMQGLYARSQTEPYVPPPVVDGVIPKNDFGNIDLYVPSMLPRGSVHVPYKGVQKIAKKLGINYAEAVTGFEFKKRRAFPVIEGIVIATENEQLLLDAYWESEQDAQKKAQIKRRERAIKQWTRLIHGLRIRQRLQAQYARKPDVVQDNDPDKAAEEPEADAFHGGGGGFLVGADDVVQKFRLPKLLNMDVDDAPRAGPSNSKPAVTDSEPGITYEMATMDLDDEVDDIPFVPLANDDAVPMSMMEMAEAAAQLKPEVMDIDDEEWVDSVVGEPAPKTKRLTLTLPKKKSKPAKKSAAGKKRKGARKRTRGEEGEEEEVDEMTPSPAKKARARAPAPVVASTRTLRPRRSKTKEQLDEEATQEQAIRVAAGEDSDD
ncbi:Rad4-domain-containing protein [Hymenopellis radicata]|nr:Rad4-domain-containing protein [Hymenopellis radicata]